MNARKLLWLLACSLGLAACASSAAPLPVVTENVPLIQPSPETRETDAGAPVTNTPLTPEEQVRDKATAAVQALRDQDMLALAALVHPEAGLRFSPYSYILQTHLTFLPSQLPSLWEDPRVYTWGSYDGSGEPIELTFRGYFSRFVYDRDFANAERSSLNKIIQQGNTLVNILDFYPGAMFVEYNFSQGVDPASLSKEMEWKSLRLVFLPLGTEWYLVAIAHDQWTI